MLAAPRSDGSRLSGPLLRLLVVLTLGPGLSFGCSCGEDPLAELESTEGTVERDHASDVGQWQAAPEGDELFMGDGLRTAADSGAVLLVSGAGELTLEEETTIRFLETAPGEETGRVSVEAGEVQVEATEAVFEIETTIGIAVVEPGGRLRVQSGDEGTRIEVQIGQAELVRDGESTPVAAGHGLRVEIGSAEIVPYEVGAEEPENPVDDPQDNPGGTPNTGPDDTEPDEVRAVIRGAAARVRAEGEEWQSVPVGDAEVQAGATVEVAPEGTVELSRGEETAVLGPGRYVVGEADEGAVVRADRGTVTLSAGSRDIVLQIPGGTVIARAAPGGSRAQIDIGEAGSEVQAEAGSVDVQGPGIEETLESGESATVPREAAEADPVANPPATQYDAGPGYRDFTAQAGESFTVRDPRPPTSIGLLLPAACSDGAEVELLRGRRVVATFHGSSSINVLFPQGSRAYRVRCDGSDSTAAEGTIRVVQNQGLRSLPRLPPASPVEANGRPHNVLYQNRLPEIRARWSEAPEGAAVRLRIDSPGGRSRTVNAPRGRATLRSGQLAEGTHQLTFVAGGQSSPTTTVRIRFDNAAEVASVQEPRERGFRPGQPVQVSGTALPGWRVRVGGTQLSIDRTGRFTGNVPTSAGQRAIAIRFSAPGRGESIYVRHGAHP